MNENLKKFLDQMRTDSDLHEKIMACTTVEDEYKVASAAVSGFTLEEFKEMKEKMKEQPPHGGPHGGPHGHGPAMPPPDGKRPEDAQADSTSTDAAKTDAAAATTAASTTASDDEAKG